MAIAAGLYKQLAYKVETTFGTAAGQAGGQLLRRTKSTLDLSKDTYASNELRTEFQIADFRHGARSVGGTISGELSPGTYKDFLALAMKRAFAAVAAISGASITIAGAGPTYTLTRAAGSYLTDGFKVGMGIRLSVGTFNAANINKNLLIVDLTATVATVMVMNGSAMVAEGPITGSTVTAVGKVNYIPTTGQLDQSMSIEHWYSDLVQSELFVGCKIDKVGLSLPPTGLATIDLDVLGQNLADTSALRGGVVNTSQYFTTPTAVTTSAPVASVNGVLRAAGVTMATLTGLTIAIDPAYQGEPVVGSNVKPALFAGPVTVTGQMTAFFDSVTLRDAFVNETEIDLLAAFTTDNTATADFMTIYLPRIKVGGAQKDDGMTGLHLTLPFQALLNVNGGAGIKTEKTTIQIQDTLA